MVLWKLIIKQNFELFLLTLLKFEIIWRKIGWIIGLRNDINFSETTCISQMIFWNALQRINQFTEFLLFIDDSIHLHIQSKEGKPIFTNFLSKESFKETFLFHMLFDFYSSTFEFH